ncbi:amino acid ABC transporter permease [Desulfococcaceae bacterium HSG9]|nr:amino acid ABC transporter permease [Desulfococcaceae bacterium HSG9]
MGKLTNPKAELLEFVPRPSRPPVVVTYGFTGWLKKHLFGGFWNTLQTIAVFSLLYLLLKPFIEWSVIDAVWVASTRRECLEISPDGACWAGVITWFNNLIYGRYPDELQWRINLGFGLGLVWLMPLVLKKLKNKIGIAIMAVVLYPFLANYLFIGGEPNGLHYIIACVALAYLMMIYINIILIYTGCQLLEQYLEPLLERISPKKAALLSHVACWFVLSLLIVSIFQGVQLQHVPIDMWGGLFLTVVISSFAIVMALPIGVFLALGRRSNMPVIKWFSIAIIELVRSVPMITVLFMSVTMMPLFFPNTMDLNKLSQVIIAVCIFAGAYMAETVRGGLQAISPGQFDAAKSVGLGYWQTMFLIILPQALKLMIPNIVTSFISMFKDTTLVSIIGLFDIMLMARNISIDKDWYGLHSEPLVAISFIFFIVCYGMSQYSQSLEKKLKTSR